MKYVRSVHEYTKIYNFIHSILVQIHNINNYIYHKLNN